MNAFVKKEIRLLLPNFGLVCLLALANLFFSDQPDRAFNSIFYLTGFVGCPLVAVMLVLGSFGTEIGGGTFSSLLAQPVSRQKIWETKILLLLAALLAGAMLWSACVYIGIFRSGSSHGINEVFHLLTVVLVACLAIFSGGLWTVLLMRQVAAAFWFTILVPAVLFILLSSVLAGASDELSLALFVTVWGGYSLAGFFFARWLFFRAQDLQWSGGTIALPEVRGLAGLFSSAGKKRSWRPRAALAWKELQLHQAQFIIAGVLALLHLGVLAARKYGHYQRNSATEFILELFWGLWLVMPLLVGCAAVAEERKLGTLVGQLGLPVKRRTQFAVKFRVALLLSVLLGCVLPLLLEGPRILPDLHFLPAGFHPANSYLGMPNGWQFFLWYGLETVNQWAAWLAFAGSAAIIGGISFYASTLARNTLQALAPAVLGLALTYFLSTVALRNPGNFGWHLPWHGGLVVFIGVPVLVVTLVVLAFGNFQSLNLGWRVGLRNALGLGAALGITFLLTAGVYNRAWEKLTPFEPPHGPARLSQADPPSLTSQGNSISVRLSDGRIWADDNPYFNFLANPLAFYFGNVRLVNQDGGRYYAGADWVKMISTFRNESVGLKTDGSLWVSETPARYELASGEWKVFPAGKLVRLGGDAQWSSVIPNNLGMLLVKNDGTLWHWGVRTSWNWKDQWPGFRTFTPQRLGTESNWAEVYSSGYYPVIRRTDGSLWTTAINKPSSQPTNEIAPGFVLQRAAYLEAGQWRSTTKYGHGLICELGIRADGTFRIRADHSLTRAFDNQPEYSYYDWTAVDLQFGHETNWLAVAGAGQKFVTLKDDGTLWLWNFYHDDRFGRNLERDERAMLAVKPVRLGIHSDWLAIAGVEGGIVSLAADGSLWYWPLASTGEFVASFSQSGFWRNGDYNGEIAMEPLLDFSRKPQSLGNLFRPANSRAP